MTGQKKEGDDKRAEDVDAWTDEPKDPDGGGPPAEFVDVPENMPATPDDG